MCFYSKVWIKGETPFTKRSALLTASDETSWYLQRWRQQQAIYIRTVGYITCSNTNQPCRHLLWLQGLVLWRWVVGLVVGLLRMLVNGVGWHRISIWLHVLWIKQSENIHRFALESIKFVSPYRWYLRWLANSPGNDSCYFLLSSRKNNWGAFKPI